MDEMSLQQIGDQLGLSRQRVEQIIRATMMKVKKRLASRGINNYDDISIAEFFTQGLRAQPHDNE
jgi:DNA-directed RNA polymerase sigma subunit (sigma70/sigma32)